MKQISDEERARMAGVIEAAIAYADDCMTALPLVRERWKTHYAKNLRALLTGQVAAPEPVQPLQSPREMQIWREGWQDGFVVGKKIESESERP